MSQNFDRDAETICAIATPHGVGGISVIRVSGKAALFVSKKLCSFLPEKPESHRIYFGTIVGIESGSAIDEVLASYFAHGKSFTGEETVEISCHGSPLVCREILNELIVAGARIADRGEFTYRAFMNNKLDLVQAESVLSLINSQSPTAAKQALQQLKGHLSKDLESIEDDTIWMLAHIEASIDFSTENLKIVEDKVLLDKNQELHGKISRMLESFRAGRVLKDGFRLSLIGAPNVGKSSLMNLLIEEDRAIVSEIAGTTRDVVEAAFFVDGIKVVIQDTAGLRDSSDVIEKIGMQKTYDSLKESDAVFFVVDGAREIEARELIEFEKLDPQKTFIVINKSDELDKSTTRLESFRHALSECWREKVPDFVVWAKERSAVVCSKSSDDRVALKRLLSQDLHTKDFQDVAVISQARHAENLQRAKASIERTASLLKDASSSEFVALELKEALISIQEILGKRFDDEILDRVFKEFCLGK
jgi:tRNA modification GTPase